MSTENEKSTLTYEQAGVDTAEGARAVDAIRTSVQSTYRPEVIGDIGGFGGLFSAAALKEMDDPVLVSGTDGVGTKIELARQMGIYDTVGIDLVAMCVNDVLVTGAEPLYFLDYIACGKLDSARMAQLVEGVAEGCRQAGCALIGGEMAEHPGVMDDDALDMSGFCTAVVDRPKLIDGSSIKAGDLIFGLPSNGFHSNGYSLIRRVIEGIDLDSRFIDHAHLSQDELDACCTDGAAGNVAGTDAVVATETATAGTAEIATAGTAEFAEEERCPSLGQALLRPTRIYVKQIHTFLAAGVPIKGMAHITGGGITENLDRILPVDTDALVRLDSWTMPPVMKYICNLAGLSQTEALRTFNCGIGFVLIISPDDAAQLLDEAEKQGEPLIEMGRIEEGAARVRYL